MNNSDNDAWSNGNDSPALKSKCSAKGNSNTKSSIRRKREHTSKAQMEKVSEL